MLAFIAKRFLLLIVVLLGVTMMTFLLINIAPGDPAEMIAIARYGLENITADEIEQIRQSEGLDDPLIIQYFCWLGHVLKGDFGRSLITGDPILKEISARFPATMILAFISLIISLLISIPAGIISAVKQNSCIDYLTRTGAMLGTSIPNFWLGLLLILFFSVTLGWLPVFGYGEVRHIILPSITLGTGLAAIITRLTRSSMLEVLNQDYIITARSKGLYEKCVILHHALKNALIPIITIIGMQLGHLLEGTVIVESIFAWPGIGKLLVDSIFARDFAMVQACVLLFAILFVIINLVIDILYMFIDPRIHYKKEG
ncbi:nickel ABC transporter permease [Anaerovorax odorimutans]|uniref:nickel ABC transporter permease n=1 Tax=Anaerovorax odorimutans TaxID=109327 RepID=UPI000406EEE7|nr:nickel ABC transporter permease [Anaerovorax odorimutans]